VALEEPRNSDEFIVRSRRLIRTHETRW
jgi:hypothetical protein